MGLEMRTRTFDAFNTVNTVVAFCDGEDVLDQVVALCAHYERLFSHTLPQSQLYQVNHAGGASVEVDPELAALTAAALGYCERTDGLFDITMGPVVSLWDFHTGIVPDAACVQAALDHVDYRHVHVRQGGGAAEDADACSICIDDPQAAIVLGGIAKGWIADGICDLLRTSGVESASVNLGGNVAVVGTKPDGSLWRVGIRMPQPSWNGRPEEAVAAVPVADGSVVTSGIYERAFRCEGQLMHHILDPRTGFPAQTDLLGASVVCERSLDADGYTTALIIMGLARATEFVEALPGIDAVFVGTDGAISVTSGLLGA